MHKFLAIVMPWVAGGLFVIGVAGMIWVFIAAGIYHNENMAQCDILGGSYNAWDGSGQCIKDQVILFDPRHNWRD
jgi:hypothetical protein